MVSIIQKYLKKLDLGSYDAIILNECAPTIVAGKYFSDELLNKSIVYLHGLEVENIYTKNKRNFWEICLVLDVTTYGL